MVRRRLDRARRTDEELGELDEEAGRARLARGAFAAEVTLAAARGRQTRALRTATAAARRGVVSVAQEIMLRSRSAMSDLRTASASGFAKRPK
jgi:hypothetical protein